MKGWKQINIGSLGEVVTGNTPLTSDREFYGGTHPFIKPTDMDVDRRRVTSWEENYSEKAFIKYKNSYIPAGSTGVVTIGTVGEKLFQADRNCFTNQSVNVVIPNKEYYDEDFVYYLLKYNLPKVSAANPGTASGRHHVSKSNFCAITVSVPKEKSVQTKIGAILSGFDNLIENNLKRIKLLEEIAQRTYEEWFVKLKIGGEQLVIDDGTGLPEGWEMKTLGDVLTLNYGKALKADSRIDGKYNVYGSSGVVGSHNEAIVKGPGIILGRKGNVGSVFWSATDFYPIDTVYFISSKIGLRFLYFSLLKQNFINSDAAVPGLNRNAAYRNEILLPTTEYIDKFEQLSTSIFDAMHSLSNQNRILKEARDILLPRLMSGEMIEEKKELAEVATK